MKLGQANSLLFATEKTVYVIYKIPSSFDNNLIQSVLGWNMMQRGESENIKTTKLTKRKRDPNGSSLTSGIKSKVLAEENISFKNY